jgi:hypothetical protein
VIAVLVASLWSAWLVGALLVGARFGAWWGREVIGSWGNVPNVPRADWILVVALTLAVGALWPYVLLVVALVRIVEGGRP